MLEKVPNYEGTVPVEDLYVAEWTSLTYQLFGWHICLVIWHFFAQLNNKQVSKSNPRAVLKSGYVKTQIDAWIDANKSKVSKFYFLTQSHSIKKENKAYK